MINNLYVIEIIKNTTIVLTGEYIAKGTQIVVSKHSNEFFKIVNSKGWISIADAKIIETYERREKILNGI